MLRQILIRLRPKMAYYIRTKGHTKLVQDVILKDMKAKKRLPELPGDDSKIAWYPITNEMNTHLKKCGDSFGMTKGEYLKFLLNKEMIK